MDERLIRLYEQELRHLRETAAEFGRAFPAKAKALALGEALPDPYVERLLEGSAFLAARVRLKLDVQFPQFTQSLLETVYPDLLHPTPSMAIVALSPDPAALPPPAGMEVKRGTRVVVRPRRMPGSSKPVREATPCFFELAHQVRLLPVEVSGVDWLVRRRSETGVDREFQCRAALRLRLRRLDDTPWSEIALAPLTLFAPPGDGLGYDILENILAHQQGLALRDGPLKEDGGRKKAVTVWSRPGAWARKLGFGPREALLPTSARMFEGFRFLREYFAMPERYLFFELHGFQEALKSCESDVIELIVPLGEASHELEMQVNASSLKLFCAPVVNLFSKTFSQVIEPSRFSEFHLVPDANRALDFEVHTVTDVEGYTESSPRGRKFGPFFRSRHRDKEGGAFYTLSRHARMLTERERESDAEVPYAGSEVFLSLVDSQQAPYAGDLQQIAVSALCTNRHLPILMAEGRGEWQLDGGAKAAVEPLVGPTIPGFQPVDGEYAWQLLSAFSTNYLTLVDASDGNVSALRELLALHVGTRADWARNHIAALRQVTAVPIQRPLFAPAETGSHPRFTGVGRGLEITLEFDEAAFQDRRLFVLGSVLEEFFARYVSLQSFTETVVRTWPGNRLCIRWPHRAGRCDLQSDPSAKLRSS